MEKSDNLPNGHEVDLAGNKTAYSVTNWYLANGSTSVTSHNLTSDVNFYAAQNVIEITDQDGLAYINTNSTTLSGKYILLNDIPLDDTQAGFDAFGWNPIGNPSTPFNGLFNGNGNTISNLWINRTSTNIVGLFGHAQNAQIRNLRVEAEEVKGNISVGIIAGRVDSSSISNSYSTGNVNGNYTVGGIVGYVVDTPISNSYSNGSVNGEERVGGIAGFITASSSITNSYSTANVSGNNYVGGIAGYIYGSSSVTNSYSTGTISGDYVGGIAGVVESSSAVTNNAAINPSVTGTSYINRIAGYISGSTVTNNFALDNMGGTTSGGTSKTEAELKQETTYSDAVNGDGNGGLGWKFGNDDSNPWKIDEGNGYPYLYWQD